MQESTKKGFTDVNQGTSDVKAERVPLNPRVQLTAFKEEEESCTLPRDATDLTAVAKQLKFEEEKKSAFLPQSPTQRIQLAHQIHQKAAFAQSPLPTFVRDEVSLATKPAFSTSNVPQQTGDDGVHDYIKALKDHRQDAPKEEQSENLQKLIQNLKRNRSALPFRSTRPPKQTKSQTSTRLSPKPVPSLFTY
jgi:hypothetical protein